MNARFATLALALILATTGFAQEKKKAATKKVATKKAVMKRKAGMSS